MSHLFTELFFILLQASRCYFGY